MKKHVAAKYITYHQKAKEGEGEGEGDKENIWILRSVGGKRGRRGGEESGGGRGGREERGHSLELIIGANCFAPREGDVGGKNSICFQHEIKWKR